MDWKKLQSQATSVAKATGTAANSAYKAGKSKYAASNGASNSASTSSTMPASSTPSQKPHTMMAHAPSAAQEVPPALPPRLPSRTVGVAPAKGDQINTIPPHLPSRSEVAGRQAAIRSTFGTAVSQEELQLGPKLKRAPPPVPPPKQNKPLVPSRTRPGAITTTSQQDGIHADCLKFSLFKDPQLARDLDIPLSPAWFAQQPLILPNILTTGSYTYGSGGSGYPGNMNYTQTYALQHADLSQTQVRLQYNERDPQGTVQIEQRHLPKPKPLPTAELIACAERYGPALVAYCRAHWGQQVGNGECWTLASVGLKSVPGALESQGVIHGHPIYQCEAGGAPVQIDVLRPGDVIQYWSTKFHDRSTGSMSWAGMPDHTAIITSTLPDRHSSQLEFPGVTCIVAEQNVGGVKRVQEGRIALNNLVEGIVTVYRPVSASWLRDLTAQW
ncbi:hypothetical protein BCR37DRAFT_41256 [Protomyces lactucae-debilis]|uniref:BBC1/AIM3 cysteine proteinase-fold domain-containing protein n=1 Tax=Protomyces lactucae-debilis TaxID=2754530 RepID=A0A1Y2FCL0_PROLT|nr:uncharacterized protein BCR37DRAFT_41256 [Protomyces lactucae-debilis]ORY81357.1 hypothetical protein BCR37DRAFT_41256 [Protomyces lactucae-debilis]